ncbi:2-oxoglutarate synthase [Methanocalculus chunghsingensis]|uniref:2-oxoglutarate synthase n=1 Tax=Methanocalculus chunghsingensis TaxID=156457 RepID=A0A8J8B515_9EURY|nr:2-oxoacid:ferredoxin oxidoreductase subunit beta [Methanocalculus chunghsingensis]MBR1368604.1 2-oxoglutarate synthase [Methanocalculus chunghsingensis]
MKGAEYISQTQNTWCPGCGNFTIQHAIKSVLSDLGIPREEAVIVSGIGCHAKIADYMQTNSFYAIHGRAIPVATGISLGNPDLTIICSAGDGDAYAEGLDHLIFAAKRNVDITVIIHDNRVYGLTTGQYTPTSPPGFAGKSTPEGVKEDPFNPLDLMLSAGATFIARSYSRDKKGMEEVLKAAIQHKGFSFVEVLQVCATFYDVHTCYDDHVYRLEGNDPEDRRAAEVLVREWNYSGEGRIPLGILYSRDAPTFEERILAGKEGEIDRTGLIQRAIAKR